MPEYFSLPLSLDRIILPREQREELDTCSLIQSVKQHLHLLFTTSFGEFQADPNFGCGIWEYDFDNVATSFQTKELIRQSLTDSIQKHEKRLRRVRVEIMLFQKELEELKNSKTIKKRIDITVSAVFQSTNNKFDFVDSFFVGPLSY